MQKKLIIFDLDGTLIDTVLDLNKAVNFSLEKNGFATKSVEHTRKAIGNGVAKLIARSIPDNESNPLYEKTLKDFKSYYSEHYFESSFPYKNIKETLLELKKRGHTLAVVTNKFNEGATKLINHYFPRIFDIIQGHEDHLSPKPNPEMVNLIINKFNFSKSECLYIGDTEVDYQTARNANIDIVMVSYGYRSREFIKSNIKGVPVVDTPIQILELLSD